MTTHKPRILRPDSPALTNYAPTSSSRLTSPQKACLAALAHHGGQLALERCHAAVLAGLVRRGLVEIDETHVRLVKT